MLISYYDKIIESILLNSQRNISIFNSVSSYFVLFTIYTLQKNNTFNNVSDYYFYSIWKNWFNQHKHIVMQLVAWWQNIQLPKHFWKKSEKILLVKKKILYH